ncbi:Endothelin-converting enzyme 2 [Diplogelasinospora grovesii]|uniref:Endothelin-converting enzyme 2 n=1 Tax=Diplogelasinospora grovesii TaxID=303347 RepID=A0AAN6S1D2_9PEZI|nr:Endothelin-converting enzyme 2 [Diplogelasinospora grovesii]
MDNANRREYEDCGVSLYFDKQNYWHERFASESHFEWLIPSDRFMATLERHLERLPNFAKILHLGSGTSDLQNHIRARGFEHITNVDYEPLAIERGRQLEQDAFGDVKLTYVVGDVTQLDLQLAGEVYDLVIDKSTADAVSCAGGAALLRMVECIKRCLADGGVWISLSYSALRFSLERLPLAVEVVEKIPTAKFKVTDPDIYHWCYLLREKRHS